MKDINNTDIPYSWMRRLNVFPNESIQEMQFEQHDVSIKQQGISLEFEELLLKFIWRNRAMNIQDDF